jgi:hypothetical protein
MNDSNSDYQLGWFPRRRYQDLLLCPVLLVGAKTRVSGCRVQGRWSRSRATARRAALDAVAAIRRIEAEEDGKSGWLSGRGTRRSQLLSVTR